MNDHVKKQSGNVSIPSTSTSLSIESSNIFGLHDVPSQSSSNIASSAINTSSNEINDSHAVYRPYPNIPDYEIEEELASGGYGIVYRARQKSLNRLVAIKMLRFTHSLNQEQRSRFLNEAYHLAKINHSGIVKIIQVGECESILYMVMEFVDGATLCSYAKQESLSNRDKAALILQAAEAIHHSHELGIIHRDLKPSNILIARQATRAHSDPFKTIRACQVKVTDFGLAVREYDKRVTLPNQFVGTPAYSSPEQLSQSGVTLSSDIFSLGVVLYELLTGVLPFDGHTLQKQTMATLHLEPTDLRSMNNTIERDLETICLKCLEKSPGDRYTSALELAKDLNRYLTGKPIHACPISIWERTKRLTFANPALTTVIVLLLVTMLTATITVSSLLYRSVEEHHSTERALQQAYRNFQYARESVDKLLIVLNDRISDSDDVNQIRQELLQNSLAFYRKLLQDQPSDSDLVESSASTWMKIGQLQHSLGDYNQALQAFDNALGIVRPMIVNQPMRMAEHQLLEVRLLQFKADSWMATNNEWHADSFLREMIEKSVLLCADSSLGEESRLLYIRGLASLAALLGRNRQSAESYSTYQQAIAELEQMSSQHPRSARLLELSIQTRSQFASSFHAKLGKDLTRKILERIIEEAELISGLDDNRPHYRYLLALGLNNLADFHYRQKQYVEADNYLLRADRIVERLILKRPSIIAYTSLRGTIKLTQGEVYSKLAQPHQVISSLNEAIRHYCSILARNAQHRTSNLYLWQCYRDRALAYEQLGNFDLAILDLEASLSTGQVKDTERKQLINLLGRIRDQKRSRDNLQKL